MNAFGFAIDSSDIDLLNVDLLNQRYTHLDLLDTDILSKHFVCFQDVLKTSSRHIFRRYLQDVLKICPQDVFKTCLQDVLKTSQRNNFLSSKTSSRRPVRWVQDLFKTTSRRLHKTPSRRLGRRKIVTLKTCWRCLQDIPWRRLQDVLKTNKCFLDYNA